MFFSSVLDGIHTDRNRQHPPGRLVEMLLTSFVYTMDTMRYNEFELSTEDVGKLYGIMSGNQYWLGRMTEHQQGIKDFRNEMELFVKQRLIFLIDTAIQGIHNMNNDTKFDEGATPSDLKVPDPNLRELRLVEFDILRKCEQVEKIDPNEGYTLEESYLHDLGSILLRLIQQFETLKQRVRAGANDPIRYRWSNKLHEDYDSVPVIVLIGHLIAHVAQSLFKVKTGYPGLSDQKRAKIAQELVISEFTTYSNLGTMSLAGILCCYKQPKLFPSAVLNPRGSMGPTEREFLLNSLVLDKLTEPARR